MTPLGPILELSWTPCWLHVGSMLGPCWPHVGGRWTSWGILERSWSDLEFILKPLLINIEQRVKRRGWILEKSTKAIGFCWFFEVPEVPTRGLLGMLLGSSWGSWGDLGGLLGVLGASWRRLGTSGSAWERVGASDHFWLCLGAGPGFETMWSCGGI